MYNWVIEYDKCSRTMSRVEGSNRCLNTFFSRSAESIHLVVQKNLTGSQEYYKILR